MKRGTSPIFGETSRASSRANFYSAYLEAFTRHLQEATATAVFARPGFYVLVKTLNFLSTNKPSPRLMKQPVSVVWNRLLASEFSS